MIRTWSTGSIPTVRSGRARTSSMGFLGKHAAISRVAEGLARLHALVAEQGFLRRKQKVFRMDEWPIPMDYELSALESDSLLRSRSGDPHRHDRRGVEETDFAQADHDDHNWLTFPLPGGQLASAVRSRKRDLVSRRDRCRAGLGSRRIGRRDGFI